VVVVEAAGLLLDTSGVPLTVFVSPLLNSNHIVSHNVMTIGNVG
jgi:hypothetical protein